MPIGRITSAHGIKGEVKVSPMTSLLERFSPGGEVWVADRPLTLVAFRKAGNSLIVRFREIIDRNRAEELKGQVIEAIAQPATLEEGEFLASDLVGVQVVDPEGRPLGVVEQVLPYPAHDVLVISGVMVPAVRQFVLDVDLAERRIVVKPIPGMFEE